MRRIPPSRPGPDPRLGLSGEAGPSCRPQPPVHTLGGSAGQAGRCALSGADDRGAGSRTPVCLAVQLQENLRSPWPRGADSDAASTPRSAASCLRCVGRSGRHPVQVLSALGSRARACPRQFFLWKEGPSVSAVQGGWSHAAERKVPGASGGSRRPDPTAHSAEARKGGEGRHPRIYRDTHLISEIWEDFPEDGL